VNISDLGLELSPRVTGGASIPVVAEFVRNLQVEDLELLNSPRPASVKQSLKRITARHHALARHVATGLKVSEAGAIMGYDIGYVSFLGQDPAFVELVTFYQSNVEREQRDNFARLVDLTADAADLLAERMENEPDKISTGQALEILKTGADRTGLGPSSTTTAVSVNLNLADRMKRAREAATGRVINAQPSEASDGNA
jgi:hypothetical protein